jgi:hypothetical protein
MESFRRGELVFDVRDYGPADGPVVILLHGFPQLNTVWDAVVPRLAALVQQCDIQTFPVMLAQSSRAAAAARSLARLTSSVWMPGTVAMAPSESRLSGAPA